MARIYDRLTQIEKNLTNRQVESDKIEDDEVDVFDCLPLKDLKEFENSKVYWRMIRTFTGNWYNISRIVTSSPSYNFIFQFFIADRQNSKTWKKQKQSQLWSWLRKTSMADGLPKQFLKKIWAGLVGKTSEFQQEKKRHSQFPCH